MSWPRILLVTSDLMVGSRIVGLAAACGAAVEQRPDLDAAEGSFDLVIVDLQTVKIRPVEALVRLRAGSRSGRPQRVVAFGPHVARDLLEEARAAGADDVVSRGELLGSFAALMRRWCH